MVDAIRRGRGDDSSILSAARSNPAVLINSRSNSNGISVFIVATSTLTSFGDSHASQPARRSATTTSIAAEAGAALLQLEDEPADSTSQFGTMMATTAVFLCGQLGALSVVLNLFVISALLRNRRRVLTNVFYVIVLHCAVLDVARGLCLIVYGLPYFANTIYKIALSISTKVALFRASTFALVVLRICNLLTIFNLLVFTTNEFIVIRYPLHYRRYFRRKAVLVILGCCWIISIVMGLGLLVPPSSPYLQGADEKPWHIDIATLSMLMISVLCFLVLAIVVVCYAFILRTIRQFKDEKGALNTEDTRRVHRSSKKVADENAGNRRSRMQAMSRHKYIYVIGTVLIVDLLFLCPYSGIQLVAFLHINHLIEITHSSTLIRWWLQVFIGVHSVCQPLCYFRMNEFRRLACCTPRVPWNRSRSFSQLNKTYVNTRSVIKDDDLLEAPESPLTSDPLLGKDRSSPAHSISSSSSWTGKKYVSVRTFSNGTTQVHKESADRDVQIEMDAISCSSKLSDI
ncbi:hypothetical protein Q1695_001879 [Nippostrongylus brasiliensis]|nr:hypothetical protein Q1695_001879 [Nippostrongylus brasiliensis]